MGNAGNLADVHGDVVPDKTVPAGESLHKAAVPVSEGNPGAIELKLEAVSK